MNKCKNALFLYWISKTTLKNNNKVDWKGKIKKGFDRVRQMSVLTITAALYSSCTTRVNNHRGSWNSYCCSIFLTAIELQIHHIEFCCCCCFQVPYFDSNTSPTLFPTNFRDPPSPLPIHCPLYSSAPIPLPIPPVPPCFFLCLVLLLSLSCLFLFCISACWLILLTFFFLQKILQHFS